MFLFYNEYFGLYIYFLLSFGFVFFLLIASYVCALNAPDFEKGTPYECGFLAFGDSRELFNLQFYIVALLFLIFDLEIALILPWCICVPIIGWNGYLSMVLFLVLLTLGFIFEWSQGAFDW